MNTLQFVFLQAPPDPGYWGDPDPLPINQDLPILMIAGLAVGIFTLLRSQYKKAKRL